MTALIATALCLLPLMGHVHVWPMTTKPPVLDPNNLGFDLLNEVECINISFTYPTEVKVGCHDAALGMFIKEFEKVEKHCKDENEHVPLTKRELKKVHKQTEANCTLKQEVNKNFNDLVSATKEFTEQFNTSS